MPLYTGDSGQLVADIWELMRGGRAAELFPISWPSKMDCPAWGISAELCHVGTRLRGVVGSTCESCYAMKGTFRAKNVVRKLNDSHEGLLDPKWTPAAVTMIRWCANERFRWMHSGDLQGVNHLRNIIRVCLETPDVLHWLPTREYETVTECPDEIPANLRIRWSATKVNGPAPKGWPYTSTVVTDRKRATCPTSKDGDNCGTHNCTACWDDTKNTAYLRH